VSIGDGLRLCFLFTVFVELDPVGNVVLALQIVILFLLILGLPFFRGGSSNKKNLVWHGYSTVTALILHTILVLIFMIPALTSGVDELGGLSLFESFTVWSHVVLGTAAEVLGIILVAFWVSKGPSKLACWRWKKWMLPIFVIWVISIVNGALLHILGML
jgi:hypothetical protein